MCVHCYIPTMKNVLCVCVGMVLNFCVYMTELNNGGERGIFVYT